VLCLYRQHSNILFGGKDTTMNKTLSLAMIQVRRDLERLRNKFVMRLFAFERSVLLRSVEIWPAENRPVEVRPS
jgi:hypothetical protein